MKLQLMNSKQYYLCLPTKMMTRLGWQKGDNISVKLENEKIILENGRKSETIKNNFIFRD